MRMIAEMMKMMTIMIVTIVMIMIAFKVDLTLITMMEFMILITKKMIL